MYNGVIPTSDLIGLPFEKGGRNLATGVDCFGLLIECHRRRGIQIQDFRSPEFYHEMEALIAQEKVTWRKWWEKEQGGADCPLSVCEPGRTLLFSIKGTACHVGFIHTPARFIHVWEDTAGVTVERINLWKKRIVGVYEFNA